METTTHQTKTALMTSNLETSEDTQLNDMQTPLHQKILVVLHSPEAKKEIALKRIADVARSSAAVILRHLETMTPRQRGRLEHDIDSALHRERPQPKHRNGRSVERIRIGFVDSNNLTR